MYVQDLINVYVISIKEIVSEDLVDFVFVKLLHEGGKLYVVFGSFFKVNFSRLDGVIVKRKGKVEENDDVDADEH